MRTSPQVTGSLSSPAARAAPLHGRSRISDSPSIAFPFLGSLMTISDFSMSSLGRAEIRGTEGQLWNRLEVLSILVRNSTLEVIHGRLCPCESNFKITVVLARAIWSPESWTFELSISGYKIHFSVMHVFSLHNLWQVKKVSYYSYFADRKISLQVTKCLLWG